MHDIWSGSGCYKHKQGSSNGNWNYFVKVFVLTNICYKVLADKHRLL